jgi:hypothetical protein
VLVALCGEGVSVLGGTFIRESEPAVCLCTHVTKTELPDLCPVNRVMQDEGVGDSLKK